MGLRVYGSGSRAWGLGCSFHSSFISAPRRPSSVLGAVGKLATVKHIPSKDFYPGPGQAT